MEFNLSQVIPLSQYSVHSIYSTEHSSLGSVGPRHKSVLSWMEAFRTTRSVAQKRPGARCTIRTPKNHEAVCESILQSPKPSAHNMHILCSRCQTLQSRAFSTMGSNFIHTKLLLYRNFNNNQILLCSRLLFKQ